MSIGVHSIGETAIAAQADPTKNGRNVPPHKRTIVASADRVTQPEPR